MSIVVLKIMLILGIIGHAINMYCDRILSIMEQLILKISRKSAKETCLQK